MQNEIETKCIAVGCDIPDLVIALGKNRVVIACGQNEPTT